MEKNIKLTKCCEAHSTYYDEILACKKCYKEVEIGEGDGTEYADGTLIIDYNSSKYVECAVCETKIHHECIDHIDNKRYDLSGHDDLNKKPVCENCIYDLGIFYTVGIKK